MYEKELKDAAARELMLAEEAAMLDKVVEIALFLFYFWHDVSCGCCIVFGL